MYEDYTKGFKRKFQAYVKQIEGLKNVKTDGGYTCYWAENEGIALKIPRDKIVVDVGCSFGLQHILYKNHREWIGIQKFKEGLNCDNGFRPEYKIFTKNAKIIDGYAKDILPTLGITKENQDQYFGLASHSLWHDEKANKKDIEIFKRSFPVNYYATDEKGQQIIYNNMPKKTVKKVVKKTTKKVKVSACDHIWIKNEGEGLPYACKNCGEQSN